MTDIKIDKNAVAMVLNKILETELAGVVRYTHYAFMICGYGRIPIVAWMRDQATESLTHANQAGELDHPSRLSSFTGDRSIIGNAPP